MASGDSLIPDGVTSRAYKFSGKQIKILPQVYTDSAGDTFGSDTPSASPINNTLSDSLSVNLPITRIQICNMIVQNKPLIQSTPKPVKMVLDKVTATNSHSVYKGAMVTASTTGKIAVGNGTNGLESKVLGNTEGRSFDYTTNDGIQYCDFSTKILATSANTNGGTAGHIYAMVKPSISTVDASLHDFSPTSEWWTDVTTTPQHSTITLDNSDSPACKYFSTLCVSDDNEYVVQLPSVEVIYDTVALSYGEDGTFSQLTNGTLTDLNGNIVKTSVVEYRTGVYKGNE